MQYRLDSQELFQALEEAVRLRVCGKKGELMGSFAAFYRWLHRTHPELVEQAETVALDIRMWRDKQDVLHRIWERIYYQF
jgi:hypothetical protein